MAQNLLKPGTGGYTVIPNWALDSLANAGSNAMALGILLLRLIPGQTGEIILTGDTSRRRLCSMLQWGTENSAKFDQALSAVESTGLVTTRIENGNAKIVAIDASLETRREADHQSAPTEIAPAVIALAAPAKNALPDAASTRTRSIKNKFNINKLTLPREPARGPHDDDDQFGQLESLLALYTSLTGQPVPERQRRSFLANLQETTLAHTELCQRLEIIAAHPLLSIETTSINALWHFAHLRKKAADFDRTAHDMITDLARRHHTSSGFEQALHDLVRRSYGGRLSLDKFLVYFKQLIEELSGSLNQADLSAEPLNTQLFSAEEMLIEPPSCEVSEPLVSQPVLVSITASPDSINGNCDLGFAIPESDEQTSQTPNSLQDVRSTPAYQVKAPNIISEAALRIASQLSAASSPAALAKLIETTLSELDHDDLADENLPSELRRLQQLAAWLRDGTLTYKVAHTTLLGFLRRAERVTQKAA
jgi:hypothetical protein